jgi:ATP-dependent Clp protease ATP-binding subunit ClpA
LTRLGHYNDRRYNRTVDSSEIIWIIASNLGTETINEAYKDIKDLDDETRDHFDLTSIQTKVRDVFFSVFGVGGIALFNEA